MAAASDAAGRHLASSASRSVGPPAAEVGGQHDACAEQHGQVDVQVFEAGRQPEHRVADTADTVCGSREVSAYFGIRTYRT